MSRITNAVLAFLLALPASALAQEEYTLRYNPEVDKSVRREITTVQDVDSSMGMAMNTTNTLQVTETVTKADDAFEVTTTIDRMALEMQQGGNVLMSFDSEREENNSPELAELNRMVGHSFTIKIDSLGKILSVEGADEMLESALDEADDPQAQALAEQLRASLSNESMAQLMESSMASYPEEPVVVGDRWRRDTEVENEMLGRMEVDQEFHFLGMDPKDDCLLLEIESEMRFGEGGALLEQLRAATGSDMDLEFETLGGMGVMCLSESNGTVVYSEMDQQIGMRIAVTMGDQSMDLSLDINQTISTVILDEVEEATEAEPTSEPEPAEAPAGEGSEEEPEGRASSGSELDSVGELEVDAA